MTVRLHWGNFLQFPIERSNKDTEGKVDMSNNQILTDEEINEGLILSCQAIPKSKKIAIDFDDV